MPVLSLLKERDTFIRPFHLHFCAQFKRKRQWVYWKNTIQVVSRLLNPDLVGQVGSLKNIWIRWNLKWVGKKSRYYFAYDQRLWILFSMHFQIQYNGFHGWMISFWWFCLLPDVIDVTSFYMADLTSMWTKGVLILYWAERFQKVIKLRLAFQQYGKLL